MYDAKLDVTVNRSQHTLLVSESMAHRPPKYNEKTRLMELGYRFMDVQEPNLFRNIYPYNEMPRLIFNHRIVPMNIPEHVYITDTAFRDGQQARSPYTVDQISD